MEMVKFQDMPYERPDFEAMRKAYGQAAESLKRAGSYGEARKICFDLQEKESGISTMVTICSVRNTIDMTDAYYSEEYKAVREGLASLTQARREYQEVFSASVFRVQFEQEFGTHLTRLIDAALKTTHEKIVPEIIREGEVSQQYQKDSAMAVTEFRGEKCNFYGLLKHMESTDRTERKEAFLAWAGLYEQISGKLDERYDELVRIRDTMAGKLGFASYTGLAYLKRRRFNYGPEEAAAFRRQILEIVTPAVAEIRRRQKKRLGLDRLCWYDEALLFPEGNPNPIGTMEELVAKAQRMYREMSPETGEFFDFMVRYRLFDLKTRPGKHMGGYMTRFPDYKAPFIFSNFNGTSADVDVLTHEAGHAFQGYLAMRSIPVSMLSGSTSEINEIHSMTMEHFAYPWMGSFFGDKAEDYITGHLIGALAVLPYMCCVDEFQHRVYADPAMTAADRRRIWKELEGMYMPWRDYDGQPFLEQGGFWMQKQHIFMYPFYYIDYALAQMGAFHLYGLMKTDRGQAWQDYLALCRAGGTKGYFDLLSLAGIPNPFAQGVVSRCVGHVIDEIMNRYL